jgi:glycine/D-amino acid oxidase-like deaminating enzyme
MVSAHVVIISRGVNGTSTAFSLASLDVRRVTVVERRHLAAGATGKSWSPVRIHYTKRDRIPLGVGEPQGLPRFRDRRGLDFGLTPYRIQVSIFRWPDGFTRRHPLVIDAMLRAWMRPDGRGCTLIGVELGSGHADPEKYDEGVARAT